MTLGYCRRLRVCVCVCVCACVYVCVCQSLACPSDNSSPVQARITKFGANQTKTVDLYNEQTDTHTHTHIQTRNFSFI